MASFSRRERQLLLNRQGVACGLRDGTVQKLGSGSYEERATDRWVVDAPALWEKEAKWLLGLTLKGGVCSRIIAFVVAQSDAASQGALSLRLAFFFSTCFFLVEEGIVNWE